MVNLYQIQSTDLSKMCLKNYLDLQNERLGPSKAIFFTILHSSAIFEGIHRPQNWCGPDRESEMDSTNDFPIRYFDCQKKTNPSIWWPIIMEKSHFPLKGPTQCKSLMKNFQIIDGNLLSLWFRSVAWCCTYLLGFFLP